MIRFRIVLTLLLYFSVFSSFAATIKGIVVLDSTWTPIVYLSVIQHFDDFQTASYDFLRFQVKLDSSGYFEIKNMELEEGDRLYRLHMCKKGDPVSTIMIGGQEENFIHFIMNNDSNLQIVQNPEKPGIQYLNILGHAVNDEVSNLFHLLEKLNTPPRLPSAQNRNFIKAQVLSEFKTIADTASTALIRLLAVHFIRENFPNEDHLALMKKVQYDLSETDYSSPYYQSFEDQLGFLQYQSGKKESSGIWWLKWLSLAVLLPLIIVFVWREVKRPAVRNNNQPVKKVRSLSNQEKRVFNLLKEGKSNKEISSELHIEVSTVKSHLNKIYSRLGVKSRKDIVGRDW